MDDGEQPPTLIHDGVTESYLYDADNTRVRKLRGSETTFSFGGVAEEELASGIKRNYYTFNGQVIAQRETISKGSDLCYLHGDHLGSVSVASGVNLANPAATPVSKQEYTPWGEERSGDITATTRDFTGQQRDDTGLVFMNARYYDPSLSRFISADSIVPGSASGAGGTGIVDYDSQMALRPLTVDFHEVGFAQGVSAENAFTMAKGFSFELSGQDRQDAKYDQGPLNPQALNRYSYVLNNPLRYVDPTGHKTYTYAQAARLATFLWKAYRELENISWWESVATNAIALRSNSCVSGAKKAMTRSNA